MGDPLVLQTPLNEERNLKREREVSTPSSRPTDQPFAKRQRLNPHSEEEFIGETIESMREATDNLQTFPIGGTPSSSHRQELERQPSTEVSSFRSSSEKIIDIKGKFKEIKTKNEQLKAQAYAQYLKIPPTNQTRLMLAFDIKEGKMQMSFLKPTVQQPKSLADYLKTDFEVLAKDIHPINQIELHKKMGEMVYSTLTSKAMMAHRLQN